MPPSQDISNRLNVSSITHDRPDSDVSGDSGLSYENAVATRPTTDLPVRCESNGNDIGATEDTHSTLVGTSCKGVGTDSPTPAVASKKKAKMSSKQKQKMKKKGNAAEQAPAVGETLNVSLGGETRATEKVAMNCNKHVVRDVATAAGVDWGRDDPTPRMVELQQRHADVVAVAEKGKLTLMHLKEHNEFLATLTHDLFDEGEQMKRNYRIATAKQARSTDSKRAAAHQARAAAIQRHSTRYNNEVSMAQFEVDWLRNSPAFHQAMEFLEANWVKTRKGDYVSKKDLNDDAGTTFEDLLSSMKLEEKDGVDLDAGLPSNP